MLFIRFYRFYASSIAHHYVTFLFFVVFISVSFLFFDRSHKFFSLYNNYCECKYLVFYPRLSSSSVYIELFTQCDLRTDIFSRFLTIFCSRKKVFFHYLYIKRWFSLFCLLLLIFGECLQWVLNVFLRYYFLSNFLGSFIFYNGI